MAKKKNQELKWLNLPDWLVNESSDVGFKVVLPTSVGPTELQALSDEVLKKASTRINISDTELQKIFNEHNSRFKTSLKNAFNGNKELPCTSQRVQKILQQIRVPVPVYR